MTTPRASIPSPSDSVENDKDFAPLVKKFKVDKVLVGEEEHSTDSVENDMDFAKSKDLVGEEDNTTVPMSQDSAIDLDPRTAFSIWCCVYAQVYEDREEEECRYKVFKQNLDKPIPSSNGKNYPHYADRTEEEFAQFRSSFREPDSYSSVSSKELSKHAILPRPTSLSASMKFTAEEAFQIWRKAYGMEYRDSEEFELRFKNFQKALYLDHPPTDYGVNLPSLADRTKEELEEVGDSFSHVFNNYVSREFLVVETLMMKDNTPFPTHPIDPKGPSPK
ncbi:uncharacterized protein LOC130736888 [Lotus japonicus]|uniref:uncharacterized protein LOC130736888 n=1 Tax=Lotus japonicus TaxID=34305 RepID=UPI002589391C|nr:uncharacterized protein LOC130736888 [Lotus japonicus]